MSKNMYMYTCKCIHMYINIYVYAQCIYFDNNLNSPPNPDYDVAYMA